MERLKLDAIRSDMYKNRVVFITSAVPGIGQELVRLFSLAGAAIAVNAMEKGECDTVAALAPDAFVTAADLYDEESLKKAFIDVERALGTIDVLVNFCDYTQDMTIEKISCADWDTMLQRQLKGAFLCCREALYAMKAKKFGRIINIGSAAAKVGGVVMGVGVHYCAAAGAILGFSRGLAMEFAPYGITVNSVCPGPVDETIKMETSEKLDKIRSAIPAGRLITAEEVAGAVLFLGSDYSGWTTGYSLDINGGLYMD